MYIQLKTKILAPLVNMTFAKLCIASPFYLLFKKSPKCIVSFDEKYLKVEGSYHKKKISQSHNYCPHHLILFSTFICKHTSSESCFIMSDEVEVFMASDLTLFLHTEFIQTLHILLLSTFQSFSVWFRNYWLWQNLDFVLSGSFFVNFDVCFKPIFDGRFNHDPLLDF